MGLAIAFWIFAVVIVVSALAVVMLRNVFRSALSLILCFLSVAGIYITLSADFLAVVQVLVYVGAISILVILAIMLTREVQHGSESGKLAVPAFFVAVILFGLVTFAVTNTNFPVSGAAPVAPTTSVLAELLFGANGFILPLEIAPLLLLAAILGAIALVREK